MHARCGYTGTSRRTAFVDLNDVSRKLKPLEKPPLKFVSYLLRNLTKINQTLLGGVIHSFHDVVCRVSFLVSDVHLPCN